MALEKIIESGHDQNIAIAQNREINSHSFTNLSPFSQNFFAGKEVPAAERVIKQSIESIQCNKRWLARDKDIIIDWLSKN